MGKRIGLVAGVVAFAAMGTLVVLPAVAQAADMGGGASPWMHEVGYSKQAMGKLGFGLKNLLLGWTDLLMEPKEALDSGGNFFIGVGSGIKDTITNELGGALHTVTFFLPQIDVPLPEGGVQFGS